jgi:hypothetical protein
MLKFKDITKKQPIGKINLLTGKSITKTSTKQSKKEIISSVDTFGLNENLEKKDNSNTLTGLINKLPIDIQNFISNCKLDRVIVNSGKTIYVLDKEFTLSIEEVYIGKHINLQVVLKQKKKTILRQLFK